MSEIETQELVERINALSSPMAPKPTSMKTRLTSLPDIRAVIFDVYGTLFISGSGDIGVAKAENDEKAFREALAISSKMKQGFKDSGRGTRLLTQLIGEIHDESRREGVEYPEVDIIKVWKAVFEHLSNGAPRLEISQHELHRFAVEYENRVNPVWPMPGVREVLSTCKARSMILGIVSNAQFYTPLLFQGLLGGSAESLGFDPRCCAWSYQLLEAKPSTHLFENVLESLYKIHNIAAAQTLYIGNDLLNDIWPAQRLGCKTALFAGDQRSLRLRQGDNRCRHVEPDLVIDDLRQLAHVWASSTTGTPTFQAK